MKQFLTYLMLILAAQLYSQNVSVNCMIFIDGKLTTHSTTQGYFTFKDSSTHTESRIDFDYEMGDLVIRPEQRPLLKTLKPGSDITINLIHLNMNGVNSTYSGTLKVDWLDYRYLIIRITNLNSKKGEYYFAYTIPGMSKRFIHKEYNMLEEYKGSK